MTSRITFRFGFPAFFLNDLQPKLSKSNDIFLWIIISPLDEAQSADFSRPTPTKARRKLTKNTFVASCVWMENNECDSRKKHWEAFPRSSSIGFLFTSPPIRVYTGRTKQWMEFLITSGIILKVFEDFLFVFSANRWVTKNIDSGILWMKSFSSLRKHRRMPKQRFTWNIEKASGHCLCMCEKLRNTCQERIYLKNIKRRVEFFFTFVKNCKRRIFYLKHKARVLKCLPVLKNEKFKESWLQLKIFIKIKKG